MKLPRATVGLLAVLGAVTWFWSGCGEKPATPVAQPAPPPKPAPLAKPALVSAEKNSFKEVTAHLDPGGSFYLYFGTEQWLDGVSDKIAGWRRIVSAVPNLNPDERASFQKAFDIVQHLLKNSGIEEVSGFGMSGIAREKGFYRTKAILHHYPGRSSGYLWSAFGRTPHALNMVDWLPASTALALGSDVDLPFLWSAIQKEVAQSGFPEAVALLQALPQQFETATGMNWQKFLASLAGEYGLVLTLDEAKQIPLPLPSEQKLTIPEPGFMLAVKVKDDLIFDRLDQLTKSNQQVVRADKAGLKMRTMPVPLPIPMALRPSWARSGDYLLLATTDALIEEAVAVKAGRKPGLKSTAEFKRLAQDVPDQGNSFTFLSQRFSQTVAQIQLQSLKASSSAGNAEQEWLKQLIGTNSLAVSYHVGANTPEGWLGVGNGNQQPAKALLAVTAIPMMGVLAGIAIPNFVKARDTAQKNACEAKLKLMKQAMQVWAQENNKSKYSRVRAEDLTPYLPDGKPLRCPKGGAYSLTTAGENPKCSVPGHHL